MVRKLSRRHGHRPFGRAPTYRPALEELESRVVPSIRPPIQTYIVNVADGVPAQHDPLSLADAISKVNADPADPSAPEIIKFDIRGPTPRPYTITAPAFGGFPVINHPVSILGSSQAGYTPTTPMIVLDGSGFNRETAFVLDIAAGGSFVDGLVIREPNKNKFGFGGIFLHGGGGNEIDANFIGTDKSGTTAIAIDSQHQFLAAYGILIKGSNNNIIGGPNSGQTNLISGNETFGIGIEGSTGTIIENNYIGTKINGTDALANGIDILVHDSSGTIINGNLISGNRVAGIGYLGSSFGNLVRKNTIGTKVDGSGSVANDIGVLISGTANLGGILSSDKPTRNTIGGQLTDDFNLISGNNVGIQIEEGANQNKVSGNLIGTDFTGVLANGTGNSAGILIEGSPKNTIGGEVGVMTTKAAGE